MPQLIAFILLRRAPDNPYVFLIFAAIVAGTLIARYWRFFAQWVAGIRGGDWPLVSAVVDIVTVVPQIVQGRGGEQIDGYLATLTYFYRNPELQTGEYSRRFDSESEGQDWAASFKGNNVMVHVDPRDPSRSVLRKEEL
jgi:hypothetical protein